MNLHAIPEALPVSDPVIPEVLPVLVARPVQARHRELPLVLRLIRWPFAWLWRIGVGGLFCFNYLTSILVVGWLYRWMQGTVLRGWWKRSPIRQEMSFEAFCAALGHDAPVQRPRWFLQERASAALHRPGPDGHPPGGLQKFFRIVKLPIGSLWRNFRVGLLGLIATFLLTGPGCLVMLFGWEFGWLVSFNKVYEQAFIGLVVSVAGIGLFIVAMLYVPMAQVHQAVTGDFRAFFDFRFVWRLIQARLTGYLGLAALTALIGFLFVEVVKTAPGFFFNNPELQEHMDAYTELKAISEFSPETAAEEGVDPVAAAAQAEVHREAVLKALNQFLLTCCFGLFVALLVTRRIAAAVYRSAVIKVLDRGRVARQDLHPTLVRWFDALRLNIIPTAEVPGFVYAVRWSGGWVYRKLLYTLLVLIWFLFVAKVYVGEFFNYHPVVGFANHALIQFPCFDFVPSHLKQPDGNSNWFVKKI
jgi:hypothetical protein